MSEGTEVAPLVLIVSGCRRAREIGRWCRKYWSCGYHAFDILHH